MEKSLASLLLILNIDTVHIINIYNRDNKSKFQDIKSKFRVFNRNFALLSRNFDLLCRNFVIVSRNFEITINRNKSICGPNALS